MECYLARDGEISNSIGDSHSGDGSDSDWFMNQKSSEVRTSDMGGTIFYMFRVAVTLNSLCPRSGDIK